MEPKLKPNRKRSFCQLDNDNDNETEYEHHDGNWESYIGNKRRKLIHQFRANVDIKSNIFEKHVIWVNGRTDPPLSELKQLIVCHGGIAVNTLTPNTSAMIADNLPMAKLKQLHKNSNLIVSTPQWILKSIEANKLLNPSNFPLAHFSNKMNKNSITNYQTHSNTNNKQQKPEQSDLLKIFGSRSTLTDPNFVENFFKSSRLHFIGSFKQIYEGILPELQAIKPKYDTIKYKKEHRNREMQRNIIHLDMDCYFVSVAVRNEPQLSDKACVVCHSQPNHNKNKNKNKSQSTAEISSANYVARKYGVCASMLLGKALTLCPDLVVLPYKFDDYVAISKKMYEIFFTYSNMVQYKSIDEAFIEFPSELRGNLSIVDIANSMRKEIFVCTQCPSSAGISCNILLSQMATKKAKPNGTYYLNMNEDQTAYKAIMDDMDINTLPGIGGKLQRKFNEEFNIYKCRDLRQDKKWNKLSNLQSEFGKKIGLNIHNYLNGIDERQIELIKERKSIGVEIGWGVRFRAMPQLHKFVNDLSVEVSQRMKKINVNLKGKQIQIRVKTKHPDANEEAHKFLGHGWCNNVTRSMTLNVGTNDHRMISKACWNMLIHELNVDHRIVRAVGIHLTKLNYNRCNAQNSNKHKSIQSMFEQKRKEKNRNANNNILPAFSQIDANVLESLPRDIQIELSKAYKHQLLMRNNKNNKNVITKLRSKFSKTIVVSEKIKKKVVNKRRKVNLNRDKKQKKLNVIGLHKNNRNKNKKEKEKERVDDDYNDGALFGEEAFEEHRDGLMEWFKHNKEPNKSHQVLLNIYIEDCIEFDRLENIFYVLKYLQRVSQKNANWQNISVSVTESTQTKIQQKYKYKLQLPATVFE